MPIKHEVGRFRLRFHGNSSAPLICRDLYGLCGRLAAIYIIQFTCICILYFCLQWYLYVHFQLYLHLYLHSYLYGFVWFVGRLTAIYNLQNIEFYAPTGACQWPFQKDDLTCTWSEWRSHNLLEKGRKSYFFVKKYLIRMMSWQFTWKGGKEIFFWITSSMQKNQTESWCQSM